MSAENTSIKTETQPTSEILDDITKDGYYINEPEIKAPKIGQFKTKEKFIEFIGGRGQINFISEEATIEGKYLSGLDMDGITFKLTICDENTVNFEEIGTNQTTPEQRLRLLDVINDKSLAHYRKKMVVAELPFKSVIKIKDQVIDLYLSVEYTNPYNKLKSLFDEDVIEITDEQSSKIDDFLSSLFEEEIVENTGDLPNLPIDTLSTQESEIPVFDDEENRYIEPNEIEKSDYQKIVEASFKEMKEKKIDELKSRIEKKEKDVRKHEMDSRQNQQNADVAKDDLKVLESRLESLLPAPLPNGYVFMISEEQDGKMELEDSVSAFIHRKLTKLKGINADALMKIFISGEYQLRIGKDGVEVTDYENLPEDIKLSISKIGFGLSDGKIVYLGDLKWHDLVDKVMKAGFVQDHEFDKLCGSNSYRPRLDEVIPEITPENNKNMIQNFSDFNSDTDTEEIKQEFKENYGYEMGKDFIFAMAEDLNPMDPSYAPFLLAIQPKSYWDNEKCQYDQHVGIDNGGTLSLPVEFEELMESSFAYLGSDPVECIDKLVNLGIKFDFDFNKFMESHVGSNFRVNGLLLEDFMKQNYPNSIV